MLKENIDKLIKPNKIQETNKIQESNKIQDPIESDHILVWIDIEETKGEMFAPMQEWAIQIAYDYLAK